MNRQDKPHPSTPIMVKLKLVEPPVVVAKPKQVLGCKHNMERWIEWEFTGEPEGSDISN